MLSFDCKKYATPFFFWPQSKIMSVRRLEEAGGTIRYKVSFSHCKLKTGNGQEPRPRNADMYNLLNTLTPCTVTRLITPLYA